MTDEQAKVLNSFVIAAILQGTLKCLKGSKGINDLLDDVRGSKTGVYLSVSLFSNNSKDNTANMEKQLEINSAHSSMQT